MRQAALNAYAFLRRFAGGSRAIAGLANGATLRTASRNSGSCRRGGRALMEPPRVEEAMAAGMMAMEEAAGEARYAVTLAAPATRRCTSGGPARD